MDPGYLYKGGAYYIEATPRTKRCRPCKEGRHKDCKGKVRSGRPWAEKIRCHCLHYNLMTEERKRQRRRERKHPRKTSQRILKVEE